MAAIQQQQQPKPAAPSEQKSETDKPPAKYLEYVAPKPIEGIRGKSVFLAGSIEMGAADNWQPRFTERLRDIPCTIFNPRRKDWDSSWVQRKTNPYFLEQVTWELDCLNRADVIALYFDEHTKSPITLLELGLHIRDTSKIIVCCPAGFYRKGNVEILCERVGIQELETFDELVEMVRERLMEGVPVEERVPLREEKVPLKEERVPLKEENVPVKASD